MARGAVIQRMRRGGALVVVLALGLGACGDDGVAGSESEGATSSATTGATTDSATTDATSGTAGESEAGELDILDKLAAIDGMRVVERFETNADGRFFELYYRLPIDHDDPGVGDFELFMTLTHRSEAAPTVLLTTGYRNYYYDFEGELSALVGGNQLSVEKRYTGISKPDADWRYLDAAQVAADGHAIVDALRPIYAGPWLRTGASLGGEDAVYHHYFYPEDFDGVVAYVAPFVLGLADARFVDHFASAVPQACQAELEALQAAMLGPRRGELVAGLADVLDEAELTRVGGYDRALQTLALEMPWSVWQSIGAAVCADVPAGDDPEVTSAALLTYLADIIPLTAVTDASLRGFEAYSYQAFTQLGRPAVPLDHLAGLVDPDYVDLETGAPPPGVALPFDAALLPAVHAWVASDAERLVFVYGDYDPWGAGRIDVSANPAVASYHDPTGTHGTQIADLAAADEAAVKATIEAWIDGPLAGRPIDRSREPRVRVPR
ncbi:MAG: hypothetical protein R3A79_06230 [Nannocystaceae bacterium]